LFGFGFVLFGWRTVHLKQNSGTPSAHWRRWRQMLPLENSLAWVRGASVGMRGGRVGTSDELVGERRLLEIGAGHGLSGVLRDVQLRLLSYWDLLGDDVVDPESINAPDFEVRAPRPTPSVRAKVRVRVRVRVKVRVRVARFTVRVRVREP